MADYNLSNSTTTQLNSISTFNVDSTTLDSSQNQDETYYDIERANDWLGYWKQIPEFQTAVNAYATWAIGKGWSASDARTGAIVNRIRGWGEDTFNHIMWNLIVCKKVYGDAFAEVIRDPESGTIVNMKVLDPARVRTVVDSKGIIKRYEYRSSSKDGSTTKFKPQQILHLSNNRIGDEIHGTPITESVEWVIKARQEAMEDWRRISHRSTIRVLYIDADNASKINQVRTQYKEAINKGEVMIIPGDPKDAQLQDISLPPIDAFLRWIQYLENFFYQALGVPKVILGGSEEFTESSAKISYLTYEQIYTRETTELEADLKNQLGLNIRFNKPASLKNEVLTGEDKNSGQLNFQPGDTSADVGRA